MNNNKKDFAHYVRPIITLVVTVAALVATFTGLLAPYYLGGAFVVILAFWFGERLVKNVFTMGFEAGSRVPEQVTTVTPGVIKIAKEAPTPEVATPSVPIKEPEEVETPHTIPDPVPDLRHYNMPYEVLPKEAQEIVDKWLRKQVDLKPQAPTVVNTKETSELLPFQLKNWRDSQASIMIAEAVDKVFPQSEFSDAAAKLTKALGCRAWSDISGYFFSCWVEARERYRRLLNALWRKQEEF